MKKEIMKPFTLQRTIFTLLLLLVIPLAHAQEHRGKIELIGTVKDGKVLLRWAPNTVLGWQTANNFGYYIERTVLSGNGQETGKAESLLLNREPLKPLPLQGWAGLAGSNKYAAITAQALYGESFQVSPGENSGALNIYNQVSEQEQRYSFALLSADFDFEVARGAALGFEDPRVKEGETYLYKIYSPIPESLPVRLDTGFFYLNPAEVKPLPVPKGLTAIFGDGVVSLQWNHFHYQNTYIAYQLERSDDGGKTFRTISELPITNTKEGDGPLRNQITKLDSLPDNNNEYAFRIRGFTSFGELGPPSEPVRGKGKDIVTVIPAFERATVTGGRAVELQWNFPPEFANKIQSFTIERASSSKGPFRKIADGLDKRSRVFVDLDPGPSNYYIIKALGESGQEAASFPYLVQLNDKEPPAPPQALAGKVDSLGYVTLQWQANSEPDLHGYQVFRSNFKNKEFIQVTRKPLKQNIFTDTIAVNTLTEDVFYKVVALDNHFNPSDYSAMLALQRPDLIPPVQPVFVSVKAEGEGIRLSWHLSSSQDVVSHGLYRRSARRQEWQLITEFTGQNTYLDEATEHGETYQYTLIAIDDSGLESAPAKPVTMKRLNNEKKPTLQNLQSSVDRTAQTISISWKYTPEGVTRYLVYRAKKGEKIRLYDNLPATSQGFVDRGMAINSEYIYRVKAVFEDGGESPMSRVMEVSF